MKVQGANRPIALDSVRAERARGKGGSDAPGAPRGEQVKVSSEARVLHEARGPEVPDQERIERLKSAITEGRFQIDPERIASAMLAEEL